MLRKTLLFVAGLVGFVLLVAGPLFLVKRSQFKAMGASGAAMVMPPTIVTSAPAAEGNWENTLGATGSMVAVQGVTIGAELPGKVVKIAFDAGSIVQAGDVLVQFDISTEEAQLRSAEASAALAKANLERARDLRQTKTNAPAELDAADAQAKQALAQADNIRAVIAKKSVRAPFTGRLGLRLVNLGQIMKDGEPITTLQTMDPIYVNFALPQQRLPEVAVGNVVRLRSDAAPGRSFEGKVTAISPEIDPGTRNFRVQATLANGEEKLRAGMFVSVDVVLPTETKVLAIPVTAVVYAPFGDSVFVIDEKKNEKTGKMEKVLRQQFVRLGEARGDFVAVVEGLKPNENVVTSGVFKLRPGMPVIIDNALAPKAQLAPKPGNA
ncbi:MAG: efflux RND transporter periplasmic adaptor subunit [Opitutus sp.]|nr:efflux RND transporter periplasmic adaptor subunit [Opitutus sp.]